MTDVPAGDWSPLLVGHQWPASATLGLLAAAAEQRTAAHDDHENYADMLRGIRVENLDIQEGATAEAARAIFHSGEQTARAIAAKNRGKSAGYRAAHQAVSQLRADLHQIAELGNAAIRQVMDSDQPGVAQRSAIVAIVVDAQQQANARAAIRCADLFPAVHHILGAEQAGHTARDFARLHGLMLPTGFGSPNTERVDAEVSRMMSQQQPDGGESAAAAGAIPSAAPAPGDGAPVYDGATPQTVRPEANAAIALPAALIRIPAEAPPTQPAPPADGALPRVDSAVPTTTGAAARFAPGAATRVAPVMPVQKPGGLPRYGSGQPSPAVTAPAPATARSAPTAGNIGAPGPTTLVPRRTPAAQTTVATATATPAAVDPRRWARLHRLLEIVARQCPTVRWAIGDRVDGSAVITTDLAGGWIPHHVRIPHGVSVLAPANRYGDARTLLDSTTLSLSYRPGDPLAPPDDAEQAQMSSVGQRGIPAADLGWELAQATRWRDGLPRIAHTLARALSAKTGYLDSEAGMLRAHVAAAADDVLGGYPETAHSYAVANWQLLAAIAALLDGETGCADYHFGWFRVGGHG